MPKISFDTKKLIQEKTPTFHNLMKFAKGLKVNFKELGEKYKALKQENIENVSKIQQLERKVASYELKLENLGLSPDVSLKNCMALKPQIQGALTALAVDPKSANSTLKDEKNIAENTQQVQQARKIKPR